jgi:glycosyltransferase involved in cell wall biosynthesis
MDRSELESFAHQAEAAVQARREQLYRMKVSVLIPAYNSAATIAATLDSVLCQTAPADEILVMNDGSTDDTAAILKGYEPRIKMFSQRNGGLSKARNELIARARGELMAFLDSDDLWHPRYLHTQKELFAGHPTAAALFVDHTNFYGLGPYDCERINTDGKPVIELMAPLSFLRRYREAPGPFVMSFCCVPRRVLDGMGSEPFKLRIAEDAYFCNLLVFWGSVVYASAPPLAAYRIREGSLSSNRLKLAKGELDAYELADKVYRSSKDIRLVREFARSVATKRRGYAKMLLGVGRAEEAREQLRRSLAQSSDPASLAKSLRLLCLSYLPSSLQPAWPSVERQHQADPSDQL